jgi:dTMP kinase
VSGGRLVTFEGIEGVGKSTQIARAGAYLESRGVSVLVTREPGGTALGERIRALLLEPELPSMHAMTELLLMFAARNEHCERVIFPALTAGTWVISDRFVDASYAYQGAGRGLPLGSIETLEKIVLGQRKPDLTLLFDATVELALGRAAARSTVADRFEAERADFFTRARECYLARARAEPDRFSLIDAGQDLVQVSSAVESALNRLF